MESKAENKNPNFVEIGNRMVVDKGWEWQGGRNEMLIKGYKL